MNNCCKVIRYLAILGMVQLAGTQTSQSSDIDSKVGEGLLAKLKVSQADPPALRAALKSNGLRVHHDVRSVPGLKVLRAANPNASPKATEALGRRIQALTATGLFEYVEPNFIIQLSQALPTDSAFTGGDLWGLLNTGQNGGVAGIDVNAVPAWSITTGSAGVVVGVIDTGIRTTHQDLSGNMWSNALEIPGNGLDDDDNGYIDDIHGINALTGSGDPTDDHDHGTHVAGTIAATAFDSGRHVGVAYGAKLMALKFLDSTGSGDAAGAIECIDYAITNGVGILNASWGGPEYSQALKDTIEAAGQAGILFIAGAGNSGADNESAPFYPASHDSDNIISVAAIDRTGAMAYFSNFGAESVDLAAPGVDILSTTAGSDSSYAYKSGTSMATPHVTGVAALLKSEYPGADVAELKLRLLQSTVALPALNGITATGGMIDAHAALLIAEDGDMEFQAGTSRGALLADEFNTITIAVSDFYPVTGATVTAFLDGNSPTAFLDNGIPPDIQAGDAVYTASLLAPSEALPVGLNISATAPGKNLSSAIVTFNVVAEFSNDNFADRLLLQPGTTSTTGSNIGASWESNEPYIPLLPGDESVWWEWVAPTSNPATIDTIGSNFDTALAVYTGDSLAGLVYIAGNDDISYPDNIKSRVSFTPVAGESYKIQVYGSFFESGEIWLNYPDPTPPSVGNDFFDQRIVLQPATTQAIGTNEGASLETGEPVNPATAGTHSVWWEWNAPVSGTAVLDTSGSSFDTTLAVYTGDGIGELSLVAANDNGPGLQSEVAFVATQGTSYKIQVNGSGDQTGTVKLNFPSPAPPKPANDDFHDRIQLLPGTLSASGTNAGANIEVDEPLNPAGSGTRTVWWEWVAAAATEVVIDTLGSDFDTTLAVYSGSRLSELVLVAENNDAGGPQSAVTFTPVAGSTYHLQVNGYGPETGSIVLNYPSPGTPTPENDSFADRLLLAPGTIRTQGSNESATLETGEPLNPLPAGGHTVWWEYVAASSGPLTIDTIDSTFDTTLAIYTGTDLASLSLVGANDDFLEVASSVTFDAVAGESYFLQVDGSAGSTGLIFLNYPMPFPVAATPGRIRVAGSPGGSTATSLRVMNGDLDPVSFSLSSPDPWVGSGSASGILFPGIEVAIPLSLDPLPAFTGAAYTTVTLTLDHPSLPTIEVPIEVVDEAIVIDIPDPGLRRAVEQKLGRLPAEPIVGLEMQILTTLDASGRDIVDLSGLEHASNLFNLFLNDNRISDMSALSELDYLVILDLYGNNLPDISLLQSLPSLTEVDVRYNYLDILPGSDDRAVIDALGALANVQFDPQKPGLRSFADWSAFINLPVGDDGPEDVNGPLALPNILSFMMGINPFLATSADLPIARRISGTNIYTFSYYRDLTSMGVAGSILSSMNLQGWTPATPARLNILWDDGNGRQYVEAIFESSSDRLFFVLEATAY